MSVVTIQEAMLHLNKDEDAPTEAVIPLLEAAEQYVRNAIGREIYPSEELAKTAVKMLLTQWDTDRAGETTSKPEEVTAFTNIIKQLQYSPAPTPPVEGT